MRPSSPDIDPLRGLLATLAPAAVLPLGRFPDAPWAGNDVAATVVLAGHLGAVAALFVSADQLPRRPRAGRVLATLGIVLVTLLCIAAIPRNPALGFTLLLFGAGLVAVVWPGPVRAKKAAPKLLGDVAPRARSAARVGAWAALPTWFLAVPGEWAASPVSAAGTALSLVVSSALAARWAWIARRLGAPGTTLVAAGAGLTGVGALVVPFAPLAGLAVMGAAPPLTLLATRCAAAPDARQEAVSPVQALLSHPARALVATFAVICVAGAGLLSLPVATTQPVSFIDALFTAVSATCVTGLTVLDTPTAFTGFGHVVLLLLIQVGALGILTFSTAGMALLGQRMSVRHEGVMADMFGHDGSGDVFRAVRDVLRVTFVAEGVGAALLWPMFWLAGDGPLEALWRAVFTAVSAYCSAGFALQSTSLVPYQSAAAVLYVVGALITLGGFSPALVLAARARLRGARLPLQHQLAVTVSGLLVAVPALALGFLEWNGAFAGLAPLDRVHNAIFHSVTLRSGGFNAIDMEALQPATRTLFVACMFVGGSPGSTAGGIKTTTAALLALAVLAAIRGQEEATAFGRRISHASIYKAAAVVTVGIAATGAVLLSLQLTQTLAFDVLLFETVSALATVGLSIGGTSRLDEVGRVIVALAMFMGRVGPLTLFLLLSEREARRGPALPEVSVAVG